MERRKKRNRRRTVGVVEAPGAVLGHGDDATRVGTEVEAPDARRVARQLEGAPHLVEIARLGVGNLEDLDVGRESCTRPVMSTIRKIQGRLPPSILYRDTVEFGYIIHPRTGPKWLISAAG